MVNEILTIVTIAAAIYAMIGVTQKDYYKRLIIRSGDFEGGPQIAKEIAYWTFSIILGPFILWSRIKRKINTGIWL